MHSKIPNFAVLEGKTTCFFTINAAAKVYIAEFKDEHLVKSYPARLFQRRSWKKEQIFKGGLEKM